MGWTNYLWKGNRNRETKATLDATIARTSSCCGSAMGEGAWRSSAVRPQVSRFIWGKLRENGGLWSCHLIRELLGTGTTLLASKKPAGERGRSMHRDQKPVHTGRSLKCQEGSAENVGSHRVR